MDRRGKTSQDLWQQVRWGLFFAAVALARFDAGRPTGYHGKGVEGVCNPDGTEVG
jgi:hypothetical protein